MAEFKARARSTEPQIQREFQRVSEALSDRWVLPELHAEPAKIKERELVFADGTNWDPGSGKGTYIYYDSAWHFLG